MGCDKVRVFAGTRVADPATVYQMIADTLGEMSKVAEKEKVYLLLENEGSQNVATAAELADVMKLIPSKWVGYQLGSRTTPTARRKPTPKATRCCPRSVC